MVYMIILVVHDIEKFEDVMDAWKTAGVPGVTILPSIGMKKLRDERALREDMPLMPMLSSLFEQDEELNRTLFTIVDGEEIVDRVVESTQSVLGNLNQPNNGVMVVLPAARAYGINRKAI